MLFNQLQFIIFFICVYFAYIILRRSHRWQNILLLFASYIFYAAWNWRFLPLLLLCTTINFFVGLRIGETDDNQKKRSFLLLGLCSTLLILVIFKYVDPFLYSLRSIVKLSNFSVGQNIIHLALPIGISFYTFQSLTYIIDIYRGQMKPTKNFSDFALFVSFFPLILSGPIERARRLLPQISSPRTISLESIYEGAYLFLWGLFEKIFIADNLARVVSSVFDAQPPYSGNAVLLASYVFTFQIFCDFDGYSNIARGICKFMGIDIMVNFNLPFFATNIQEYWKRWHISLSSWIKDYLYIPLFLSLRNMKQNARLYAALAITMIVMGLWHGATWTYVLWGVYQAILLATYAALKPHLYKKLNPQGKTTKALWFLARVFFMFNITSLGMLIFRAHSLNQISQMAQALVLHFNRIPLSGLINTMAIFIFYTSLLIIIQCIQYVKKDLMAPLKFNLAASVIFFYIILYSISIFGRSSNEYIYFKF